MAVDPLPPHPSDALAWTPQVRNGIGTLARLQRVLTAAVFVASGGWVIGWWSVSRTLALGGGVLIALSHVWVLGGECVAAALVNRRRADPAPPLGLPGWLQAWAVECATTPKVFYWRQPFFSRAVPDHLPAQAAGRRGVVLVHGLVCNRGFWTPWLKQLVRADRPFIAVNLEPIIASIDDYAPYIERAVQQITRATGQPPLLVCHSMGGLVARAWLRQAGPDAAARVAHVVTIGTPHHGTWLGQWSRQRNGEQMACGSEWLVALHAAESAQSAAFGQRFTCWYSNGDHIVFPASSATLEGADNRLLPGVPHVALAFQPEVMRATLALLHA